MVSINEDICTGCSGCVNNCSAGILYIDDTEGVCKVIEQEPCTKKRECETVCPTGAISVSI